MQQRLVQQRRKCGKLKTGLKQLEARTNYQQSVANLAGRDWLTALLSRCREIGGGRGWIRTSVAVKREIYSLVDLTTLPPFHADLDPTKLQLDAEADETETKPGLTWERVL